MANAEDRRGVERPELTSLESAFEPEPVAPEEARRRDQPAANASPRDIVELTSPIGHRFRVPPPPAEAAPAAPAKPSKRKR